MHGIHRSLLIALVAALPVAAQADADQAQGQAAQTFPLQAPDSQPRVPELVFGHRTRTWLDMQRSGHAAAPAPEMPGPVATRVYQRYLESFTHPVPEFFSAQARGSFSTGGGSR